MAQDKIKISFNPITGKFDQVQDVSGLAETTYVDTNFIPNTEKGAANGVATLDSGGKVPSAQLPNSVMQYQGQWNANTNTPTLADGVGSAGDVYEVVVAGTTDFGSGPISFNVGDWAVYDGAVWQKSINSNEVVSVNGFTGAVNLDTDDVPEGSTNLYFTDTRARTAAVQDSISDGITDTAPSQNAVFDALALKANHSLNNITGQSLTLPSPDSNRQTVLNGSYSVGSPLTTPSGATVLHALYGQGILSGSLALITQGSSNAFPSQAGAIHIESGNRTNNTGLIQLKTGDSTNTDSGDIIIESGTASNGTRGSVVLDALEIDASSSNIINVNDPVNPQDAATMNYVDNAVAGVDAANKTLSNLTSPTSINQDLLPSATSTRTIGSSSLLWLRSYVGNLASAAGDQINIGTRTLLFDTTTEIMTWFNNGIQLAINRVLRFTTGDSNVIGIQAPATGSNQTYTLPAAAPSVDGQYLSATGAGVMSWYTPNVISTSTLANDYFQNTPTVDTWYIPNNAWNITLAPGRYRLQVTGLMHVQGTASTGNQVLTEVQLGTSTTAGASLVGNKLGMHLACYTANNFTYSNFNGEMGELIVASTTTYYVNMRWKFFSGTPTISVFGLYSDSVSIGQNPAIIATRLEA